MYLHPLAHALAHAWPDWTHHIDPFYVCSDDTIDLLYRVVSDDVYQVIEVAVFESLAAHGIPLDATVYEVAEVYACPDGLPMPPLQDLVRTPQLTVVLLQLLHLRPLHSRHARGIPGLDLSVSYPTAHRLRAIPQLVSNPTTVPCVVPSSLRNSKTRRTA
jgi:hypothetical protein